MGHSATATGNRSALGRAASVAIEAILGSSPAADGRGALDEQTVKLAQWQQVPGLVRERYKIAADIQQKIKKLLPHLKAKCEGDPGYGYVFWNPDTKTVVAILSDGDGQHVHQAWHNALKTIPGIEKVETVAESHPGDAKDCIRIKAANGPLAWLNKPYDVAGAMTGGPSPLSNALVGSLLGGGAGYLGGAVAEQFIPKRYLERGRLRKVLGLAGAGLGAVPGIWEGFANHHNANQAYQIGQQAPTQDESAFFQPGPPPPSAPNEPMSAWRAAITPTNKMPLNPAAQQGSDLLAAGHIKGAGDALREARLGLTGCPEPSPLFLKAAMGYAGAYSTGIGDVRPIPMDAFNQAIWNDVSKGVGSARNNPYGTKSPWGDDSQSLHTPPAIGAAAAGLVSGVGASYGNPSALTPKHFVNGLAAAGVDMLTARMAGGVLGALGGLTPAAQSQLQDMGLWSGLIRGVTSSVLGI